ncbi:2TM domain-containing protein [Plantactinospora solaniradicis]|uniref:2TM domain-containing protein n=1 Tax=Plantactinospora solaniradicis TaxID=1723736 RepID=A0ABW1KKM8_9ACTN
MNSTKSGTAVRWGLRIHVLGYVAANAIQVLVWWLFTPEQHFWPVWSIVGWGVGLAFHIWAVASPSRGSRRY